MIYRRIAAGFGLILVLGASVTVFAYRKAYAAFVWQEPERISWCGRVYLRTDTAALTRSAAEANDRSAHAAQLDLLDAATRRHFATRLSLNPFPPLVEVARVPPLVGRPLLASPTGTAANEPCAMVVYREVDSGTYREYVLRGGP